MHIKDSALSDNTKKFSEEIEDLLREYNVTTAVFSFAIPMFDIEDQSMFMTSKINDREYEYGSAVYVADESFTNRESKDNFSKDLHTALHLLASASIHQLINIDKNSQMALSEIDASLGLDTARMYALEEGQEYVVFTEKGILRMTYHDEAWEIRRQEGDEVEPTDGFVYKFIGNVQADGTIFHSKELPILSTGDRALFGYFDDDEPNPAYMTSTVKNVVALKSLN